MNDYTERQLAQLKKFIEIKKAAQKEGKPLMTLAQRRQFKDREKEELMREIREESNNAVDAIRWYAFPAIMLSMLLIIVVIASCRNSEPPKIGEVVLAGEK